MAKSYFIPGLTREQIHELETQHVCCCNFSDGHEDGILLEDVFLQPALQILGATAQKESRTNYEGVYRVVLAANHGPRVSPIRQPAPAPPTANTQQLRTLIEQVQKLQGWSNLSESERTNRQGLISDVQTKERVLRGATDALRSAEAKYKDLSAHVAALAGHELPALLTEGLEHVVAERSDMLTECRDTHARLTRELAEARAALDADLNTKRLSPEETLSAVENALAEAARVNKLGQ